jgi:hypothetical protein
MCFARTNSKFSIARKEHLLRCRICEDNDSEKKDSAWMQKVFAAGIVN